VRRIGRSWLSSRRFNLGELRRVPLATPAPPTPQPSDVQDLIAPLWRRRWLLLGIVVTSTVATFVVAARQPERCRARTQFIVATSSVQAIIAGAGGGASDRTTLDQAKLLLSEPVADRVLRRLGLAESRLALLATVEAEPVLGSSFVTVTAERGSADQAAAVANTFVREYFAYRKDELTGEADDAMRRIRRELRDVANGANATNARVPLQNQLRQLEGARSAAGEEMRQTNSAAAGARIAPTPGRDALFAFAISLGLALALAFGLERFDRRIRNVDDFARVYDAPLLSVIPHSATVGEERGGKVSVPAALREPFRTLRTNLELASLDKPIRRVVVASAVSSEGKSTIVRNLALTYCEWGLSVVVIEADLRRPTLSALFGVKRGAAGLTAVLTGECELEDALLEVDIDITSLEYLDKVRVGGGATNPRDGTTRGLELLPSGRTPPNPQAVLASDKTRLVIEQLSERFDVVLVDTPPLLAVSDALSLLPQVDGVVLVARVGMTQRPAAQRAAAAARLDPGGRILGVVANDLNFVPGSGYGYAYGYGYAQQYGSDGTNGNAGRETAKRQPAES
jgi:Mrp family chromosome partitioning ATPase/capsular polysaccharide biosynthesis protein